MIFELLVVSVFIQILFFIPAYIFKTDKVTDLSYSLAFFVLVLYAFIQSSIHPLLFFMVSLWALRLGSFLLIRIIHMKHDKRFDGIRENLLYFLGFFLIQGVIVWLILLPTLYVFVNGELTFSWIVTLGAFIWLLGLLIESFADAQQFNWKMNHSGLMKSGLYAYARHPNYFGEMLVWIGIAIVTSQFAPLFAVIVSPVIIIATLLFFSGIPTVAKRHKQKYGAEYESYVRQTRLLVPLPKFK